MATGEVFDDLSRQQYAESTGEESNLRRRWSTYEQIPSFQDFMPELLHNMHLTDANILLDVGCNDGSNLLRLREAGHRGISIGLDIDPAIFQAPDDEPADQAARRRRISFVVGEAQHIPLPDESVDNVFALFMLYHVPDPDSAIHEMMRVLKPGGKLGIATSGPENKRRHREFESAIAEFRGVEPPPIFSQRFDSTHLKAMYSDWLPTIIEEEHPLMTWRIGSTHPIFKNMSFHNERRVMAFDRTNYHLYLESLSSMRGAFSPPIEDDLDWEGAIEAVVRPQILQFMDRRAGFFEDYVDRAYLICQKQGDDGELSRRLVYRPTPEEIVATQKLHEAILDPLKDAIFPTTNQRLISRLRDSGFLQYVPYLHQEDPLDIYNSLDEVRQLLKINSILNHSQQDESRRLKFVKEVSGRELSRAWAD